MAGGDIKPQLSVDVLSLRWPGVFQLEFNRLPAIHTWSSKGLHPGMEMEHLSPKMGFSPTSRGDGLDCEHKSERLQDPHVR